MANSSSSEASFVELLHRGLPAVLPQFLVKQRWFGGKARTIRSVEVSDIVPFCSDTLRAYFILARVNYVGGTPETYHILLARTSDDSDPALLRFKPDHSAEEIVLRDALTEQEFLSSILDAIATEASLPGERGRIQAISTGALRSIWEPAQGPLAPSLMHVEQSNTSVVYEKRLVLKIFRRVEEGLNPDLEIGAYLTGKSSFRNTPPLAGYVAYVTETGNRIALGMLQGYVANQGDAWQFTLQALAEYYGEVARSHVLAAGEIPQAPLLTLCAQPIPDEARRRIGSYLDSAALLGRRTAELHQALASATADPNFAPQPFSEIDRQTVVNTASRLLTANFDLLRRLKSGMPDQARQEADEVLGKEELAHHRLQRVAGLKSSAMVTRIHGDYHLGQVLFTGSDFVIIDFEGEPARPLEERRKKRSPLQDVAGMLRSFHYAAYAPLLQQAMPEDPQGVDLQTLGDWASYWQKWVSAVFLRTYLEVSENSLFLPERREELSVLLDLYLLDKAVYELGYELNNRPSWVRIPLGGISQLLKESA